MNPISFRSSSNVLRHVFFGIIPSLSFAVFWHPVHCSMSPTIWVSYSHVHSTDVRECNLFCLLHHVCRCMDMWLSNGLHHLWCEGWHCYFVSEECSCKLCGYAGVEKYQLLRCVWDWATTTFEQGQYRENHKGGG